jgi:hypothetical protein
LIDPEILDQTEEEEEEVELEETSEESYAVPDDMGN